MQNTDNQSFQYTYSAKEQEEIRNIRKKYVHDTNSKLELLRKLDKRIYKKATTISISIGIIGTLILGLGMSCILEWQDKLFFEGIIIGISGIIILFLPYPVYNKVLKIERKKIAPEIIRLTDELLK